MDNSLHSPSDASSSKPSPHASLSDHPLNVSSSDPPPDYFSLDPDPPNASSSDTPDSSSFNPPPDASPSDPPPVDSSSDPPTNASSTGILDSSSSIPPPSNSPSSPPANASPSDPPPDGSSSNPPPTDSSPETPYSALSNPPFDDSSSNPPPDDSSTNVPRDDSSSDSDPIYTEDSFLHASNANIANFVSVKVSNAHSYRLWKKQILCLMDIHKMGDLIIDTTDSPRPSSDVIIMNQYNSLLKGWIFGTVSEEVLVHVIDFDSAKAVWDKLISIYGPTMSSEIVKLRSEFDYSQWKKQMLWLMKNHNIDGQLLDDPIYGLKASSKEILDQHESLLIQWIFDSVIENIPSDVDHSSVKEIWQYLKCNYDLTLTSEIVKLSGQHNYHLWKTQMLSLMKDYKMDGLVDGRILDSKAPTTQMIEQNDSLLQSWIYSSISHDVLLKIIHLKSAKQVWDNLESNYGPIIARERSESETKDITRRNQRLCRATKEGKWWEVESILAYDKKAIGYVINNVGETVFHIAVGTGHKYLVRKLLDFIQDIDTDILKMRSSDGSTVLHVAAYTGNKYAAGLLIQKETSLLAIRNNATKLPYVEAYINNHIDTSVFLFKAVHQYTQSMRQGSRKDLIDRNLLLDVISTKQYDLVLQLFKAFPDMPVKDSAEVLMALARNFPSGLDNWETLVYPSLGDLRKRIVNKTSLLFPSVALFGAGALTKPFEGMLLVVVTMLILVYQFIFFPIWIVSLPFFMLYFLLWKVATRFVPLIKHMEKRKKEREKANEVLKRVCDEIDKSEPNGTHHAVYKRPLLEAACQNAYEVAKEILDRSPEAIRWTDQNGYTIIHLAVIYRSERIYNHIYENGDRRSLSKTHIDTSKNNVLHLAGRLAPSSKLKTRTGAALQLQRELQWREEVKKQVVPTFISQKNLDEETPGMVFTREHENLVKEGEKWMKTTAKSCSITAALITTMVFAAAITVPGGSNQIIGIPLFTKEAAFIVFAVSDAISLCASTTSLLMFLSILTTRFAEQDFLIKLPTQLIFGLCFLLLSTTAMMVAFGATLFLVFSHQKLFMLVPICILVCIPITTFVILQFPLIADLILSTYAGSIFGKQSSRRHDRSYSIIQRTFDYSFIS